MCHTLRLSLNELKNVVILENLSASLILVKIIVLSSTVSFILS